MNDLLKKNRKALVIVAHPDDETIWMGGTIARYRNLKWTVLSLCRASDNDRAPKFTRVCEYLGAKSIMTDLDDNDKLTLDEATVEAEKLLRQELKNKKFSYIFTHNKNGEYGHSRHIVAYRAVNKLLDDNFLQAEKVFYFNYQKKDKTRDYSEMILGDGSSIRIDLTAEEYQAKRNIMSEFYGFAPDGPDANYCTNPEGFIIKNLTHLSF
jgi:LmbE family N-acetylglucosaminyl deacetylase